MVDSIGDLFFTFRGEGSQLERDAQRAGGAAGGAAGTTFGQRLNQGVSRALTAGGAALGVGLTVATESAATFEDQLRTINTVAGLTDDEFHGIGDQIQGLARDSGKSTDDLTQGFYDLVSAGIPAGEAIGVLRDSATLATGGLATTAETVDLVTSALNAYGLGAEHSGRVTDIFAKAIADGKTTAAELASSIAQVAPIAAQAGISLEEVSAGYADLTAEGVPAAQAATQMRAAIASLLTPNETLNNLQQQTGINFAELAREQGLSVALEEIRKATAANGDEFARLSGLSADELPDALRAAQGALGITNSDLEKLTAIAGEDGAGAAMAELGKMVGAGDSAFAKALGSVEALGFAVNTTGGSFEAFQGQIDATNSGIDGLATEQAAEKMRSPTEAAARMTQQFLTFMQDVGGPFAGTVGPMLLTLNQIGPALGGILSPAKLVGGALGGLGGKLVSTIIPALAGVVPAVAGTVSAAGTAIGGMLAAAIPVGIALLPVILVAALIAAIVAVIAIPEFREKAIEIGGAILKAIGDALGAIGEVFGAVLGAIGSFLGQVLGQVDAWIGQVLAAIGTVVESIVGFIVAIPGRVASWVGELVGQAVNLGAQVVATVVGFVGQVVSTILGIPGRVIGWIGELIGGAGRAAAGFVGSIVGMAGDVIATILGLPGRVIGGLAEGFANLGRAAVDAFLGFIRAIPEAVGNIIGGIGDFVGGLIPAFASGTLSVPHDMLALVHKGEMIIPAAEAEAIRQGRGAAPSAEGGTGAPGGPTIIVHNPAPEPASRSVARELRWAAVTTR